jgi:hypothetical protein
MGGGDI